MEAAAARRKAQKAEQDAERSGPTLSTIKEQVARLQADMNQEPPAALPDSTPPPISTDPAEFPGMEKPKPAKKAK